MKSVTAEDLDNLLYEIQLMEDVVIAARDIAQRPQRPTKLRDALSMLDAFRDFSKDCGAV